MVWKDRWFFYAVALYLFYDFVLELVMHGLQVYLFLVQRFVEIFGDFRLVVGVGQFDQ